MVAIDESVSKHAEPDGIDEVAICRTLLRIVASLEESAYTENQLRQTAEQELDDLADPASAEDTPQGLVAL